MKRKIEKTFQYDGKEMRLQSGVIAAYAASVVVEIGEHVLLIAVTVQKNSDSSRDFLPLTVFYQEKGFASGRIPQNYFRREGKPSERETLIARLIDRSIRPLFAKGITHDIQMVVTALSIDPHIPIEIPAIIGASAAVMISGIPFNGPLAAARVGYRDGMFVLNPSVHDLKSSPLNLVVAGTEQAVLMVEAQSKELPEDLILEAILYAHLQMQVVFGAVSEFARDVSCSKDHSDGFSGIRNRRVPSVQTELEEQMQRFIVSDLKRAYEEIEDKSIRQERINQLRGRVLEEFCRTGHQGNSCIPESIVQTVFHQLETELVRSRILSGLSRIDGRDAARVRDIHIQVGWLPRAHGSAVFTRGETQAVVATTLGPESSAQLMDTQDGENRQRFMLHYNFPPYAVGEVGSMAGIKRREIGHGCLAWKALMPVMPTEAEFPYVVRVVSEITASNGSSSMATVCGASLALMDAGVPLRAPVAGVAMGLIVRGTTPSSEETSPHADSRLPFVVLTDILGDEDHFGDMDLKVAGTVFGITALQMDIKTSGITKDILHAALEQARKARLHILKTMLEEGLSAPRPRVSNYAPQLITMKIDPTKIREVIGKGGATIREISSTTRTVIDIADDGFIKISAPTSADGMAARLRIEEAIGEVEVGKVYDGTIIKVMDYGAFVTLLPGRQGLVHISQVMHGHVDNIYDHLKEGQSIKVKVVEIDRQGRIRLSVKDV